MTDASRISYRVGCNLRTVSPSPVPKPNLSKLFTKASICSFVADDSFEPVR